ncbi:MAG: hypothetical protein Q8P90_00445 [bacterium]|nr:hypothetical protein [bacterium]
MMITSNNSNPEIEDIFEGFEADANVGPEVSRIPMAAITEPVAGNYSDEESTSGSSGVVRRIIIIIAISIAGLLLLGGIGFAIYIWLGSTPSIPESENVLINDNIATDQVIVDDVLENTNVIEIDIPVDPEITTDDSSAAEFIDSDHDGLSDEEELIHNTNPKKRDTDEDGLSDREEVRVYLTDPRNPDTDSDGFIDGEEVANFYHPNHPDPTKRLFDDFIPE